MASPRSCTARRSLSTCNEFEASPGAKYSEPLGLLWFSHEVALNIRLLRSWYMERTYWERTALAVWAAVLTVVCVRAFLAPDSRTVYPIFSSSGLFWMTGTDLYSPDRPIEAPTGYRYSPACTLLFVPFALLPDALGGVAWRLFSVGVLLAALAWFARTVLRVPFSTKHFAWLLLLTLPLSLQSVNNGQANIVVIGAMLAAVAAVCVQRWNLACALLAFSFACKLYPITLGMVLVSLYPRHLGWRLALALAVTIALPFALQDFSYVTKQYSDWIEILGREDRSAIALDQMYRDLWLLLHLYGAPVSRSAYKLIQLAGGVIVALACIRGQRKGWSEPKLLTFATACTTAWMMLLGPATESSSFALLAPVIAWSVVERLVSREREWRELLLAASCVFFTVAVIAGGWNATLGLHAFGVYSWASLCYFVYLLVESRSIRIAEPACYYQKKLAV